MKKKNNKGFTLIELLVAVSIMLSILGVAIVSFVNLSDRKKEEAWENVKNQIETAAEQYFKSNEYLFEGLSNGVTATISVGELVKSDYINVVTDPRNGNKISYCSLVNVTRNNGVFTVSTDTSFGEGGSNDEKDCVTGSLVTIKEVGGPDIMVKDDCAYDGNDNWCRGQIAGEEKNSFDGIKLTATSNEAVYINVNNTKCELDSENQCVYNDIDNTDSDGKEVVFTAVGSNGATTNAYVTYKIDKNTPIIDMNIYSKKTNYNDSRANIGYSASDNISLLKSISFSKPGNIIKTYSSINCAETTGTLNNQEMISKLTKNSETITVKMEVTDVAGNKAIVTKDYTTYAICKEENLNIKNTQTGTEVCDPSGIYKRTDKIFYNDKLATTYDCGQKDVLVDGGTCGKKCPSIGISATKSPSVVIDGIMWFNGDNAWITHSDAGKSYWTWYRESTLLGTKDSITVKNGEILEGKHTYKLIGKNGEECPYVYVYDNTPPTCKVNSSGPTKNSSGWYTGDVTVTLTTDADEYDLSTGTTAKYTMRKTRTHTADTVGTTYYGYVKDKAGNTNVCSSTIKKDTIAPSWDLTSTTFTHINVDDSSHSRKVVFQGDFNVSKNGGVYTGTICVNNIKNGGININNNKDLITGNPLTFYYPSLTLSDDVSGVDTSTVSYSDNFTLKDGSSGDYCPRTNSPCKWKFYISVSDKAGNTLSNTNFLSLDTGYILNKKNQIESDNFYSPCYYHSISNRYITGTLSYDEDRIINTYCKNGSCQTIK